MDVVINGPGLYKAYECRLDGQLWLIWTGRLFRIVVGPLEVKAYKPAPYRWRPRYRRYVGGTGRWCRLWTAGWFSFHWLGRQWRKGDPR